MRITKLLVLGHKDPSSPVIDTQKAIIYQMSSQKEHFGTYMSKKLEGWWQTQNPIMKKLDSMPHYS